MDLEEKIESNYIKIEFKNKLKLENKKDIKEETSKIKSIIKNFEQEVSNEDIDSFIDKLISKNTNDFFKFNKEFSKEYKKQFPFTEMELNNSIKNILSNNFAPNFIFSKKNTEDVSRILYYSYKNMKKYGINSEEKLKKKIGNITINEKDLLNIYLDFNKLNIENTKKIIKNRKKYKNNFYENKESSSTGNLAIINELNQDESVENNIGEFTIKSKKRKITKINSSDSESDNKTEGVKKIFDKVKGIFDSKNEKEDKREKIININEINKVINNLDEQKKPLLIIKEHFIYPEKNIILSDNMKLELPIELIILLVKFKNVKILTFQIKDINKKMLKENIFLLSNINILFPNFSELTVDLNNEKLSETINMIYETRQEELLKQYNMNRRVLKNIKNYEIRTVNCWHPEGDIFFINNSDIKKDEYKYEQDIYGNSYLYDNNFSLIKEYPNIKYIIPSGYNIYNNNYYGKYNKSFDELDEFEEIQNKESVYSEFKKLADIKPTSKKRISTSNLLNNLDSLKLKEIPKKASFEVTYIESRKKKTTPQLLLSFIRKKQEPFAMILLYSKFLEKISKIKTLSLYFCEGFSLETEVYLRYKNISFEGFHFLSFANKIKELNEINISFNSIDTFSFKNILGLIGSNKNISILRINFFPSNINFEVISLLKLCSLMKFSLHNLYKEQKYFFKKEKEYKDLEMDYFILNHNFDMEFEKNISRLFNLIKSNLNNYKELVFRFDLPLLLLYCEKYIILIIKFIINIITLISSSQNNINIFKIISQELILDGRITPFLKYIFKKFGTRKITKNNNIKEIIIKCKIYRLPDLFNFCLINNINNIINITIGDMDTESFNGFLKLYINNIDKMKNLKIIKIGLNNSVILYDKISDKINEFININSDNLEEKILYSFLEINDLNKMKNLIYNVYKAKINKLIIQIGAKNKYLLNQINKLNKAEFESIFFVMKHAKYKLLIKEQIIKYVQKFFMRHKTKIVICRPIFSLN